MAFAFEKLLVYQKAITFADAICTLTRDLPRGYFFLGDQLSRASLSIAANIAEGNGRSGASITLFTFSIERGDIPAIIEFRLSWSVALAQRNSVQSIVRRQGYYASS